MKNPLVQFLRHYGPISASDNLYDETIQSSAKRLNVTPIEVSLPELDELVENFRSSSPNSVILTGTAGDGKTYLCRKVWIELGGDQLVWDQRKKIIALTIEKNGIELVVVKDLSELTKEEKMELLPQMAAAILGKQVGKAYLLAANDGQLVASWETAAEEYGGDCAEVKQIIETLLVEEVAQKEGYGVSLSNLSRKHAPELLDNILDTIVNHQGWSLCASCPHSAESLERCPIYENRSRLLPSPDNLFRRRLRQLLHLAEANRLHLPIRHLLMLSVNLILGHKDATGGLMTCDKAAKLIADKATAGANPYANAFGANLPIKRRQQHLCFSVLGSFGIGQETSNAIDDLLVYGPDVSELKDRYDEFVGSDKYYGNSDYYVAQRNQYVDGRRENSDEPGLLDLLPIQRQRLFFTLDGSGDSCWSPWSLTVYRFSGNYLDMREALNNNTPVDEHIKRLIIGLNRVFTGMMVDESERLLVASSGGDGRGRLSHILETEIPVQDYDGIGREIRLKMDDDKRLPLLQVQVRHNRVIQLELTLILYEYLRRIAEGSLPSSFSHQCYEDLLGFKLRLLEAYYEVRPSSALTFRFITVDSMGQAQTHHVKVI